MTPQPPASPKFIPRLFAPIDQRLRALKVLGQRPAGFSDVYHALLRASWTRLLLGLALGFAAINAGFALAYLATGGVANARPGDFLDHFFFSVHTFGTIGYGSMYPTTRAAETVMTVEALTSLVVNAVVTGLAFARFARPRARMLWADVAVVSDRDGVPTLMFRLANERMNHVVEAHLRVAVVRAETTAEGERVRRIVDLDLVRAHSPAFILTWTVLHQIVPGSPLYGLTPHQWAATEPELVLTLTGLDETLAATIHDRHSYLPSEVRWGHRFEDILRGTDADGKRVMDYGFFHATQPAKLSWEKLGVAPPAEGSELGEGSAAR